MNELPQSIIKSTFTDLKDADGGKFVLRGLTTSPRDYECFNCRKY